MELNVIEQVIRVADGKGIMHIKERQLVGCINPKRESLDGERNSIYLSARTVVLNPLGYKCEV